jgi:hypothetical protein
VLNSERADQAGGTPSAEVVPIPRVAAADGGGFLRLGEAAGGVDLELSETLGSVAGAGTGVSWFKGLESFRDGRGNELLTLRRGTAPACPRAQLRAERARTGGAAPEA